MWCCRRDDHNGVADTNDGRQFGAVRHLRHDVRHQRLLLAVAVVPHLLLPPRP